MVGLDCYLGCWNERAVGFTDLYVTPDLRGKGYAQTLVLEVIRRLRQELVTRVELHVPADAPEVEKVADACAMQQVDMGIAYVKKD